MATVEKEEEEAEGDGDDDEKNVRAAIFLYSSKTHFDFEVQL